MHAAVGAVRVVWLDARAAVWAVGLARRGVDRLARGEDGEDELRDLRLARLRDDDKGNLDNEGAPLRAPSTGA